MKTIQTMTVAVFVILIFMVLAKGPSQKTKHVIPAGEQISEISDGFQTKIDTTGDGISDVTVNINKKVAAQYCVIEMKAKNDIRVGLQKNSLELRWTHSGDVRESQGKSLGMLID